MREWIVKLNTIDGGAAEALRVIERSPANSSLDHRLGVRAHHSAGRERLQLAEWPANPQRVAHGIRPHILLGSRGSQRLLFGCPPGFRNPAGTTRLKLLCIHGCSPTALHELILSFAHRPPIGDGRSTYADTCIQASTYPVFADPEPGRATGRSVRWSAPARDRCRHRGPSRRQCLRSGAPESGRAVRVVAARRLWWWTTRPSGSVSVADPDASSRMRPSAAICQSLSGSVGSPSGGENRSRESTHVLRPEDAAPQCIPTARSARISCLPRPDQDRHARW